MTRVLLAIVALLCCACSQAPAGGGFAQYDSPSPVAPVAPPRVDLVSLGRTRALAATALLAHLPGGRLDQAWGGGAAAALAGPYSDGPPGQAAATLQALDSLAGRPAPGVSFDAGLRTAVAGVETDAFKQLDGPQGGAVLLLADGAHPAPAHSPVTVDSPQPDCPTPPAGGGSPSCLLRQVSDGLMAAWYAEDRQMFFDVGQSSTVYRPVDAIATGAALVVAGFRLHDDRKIVAGQHILDQEMKTDLDRNFGMLYGLVTATAGGGHSVTDSNTRLADQAGAAEAMLEAFDASRERADQAYAQALLQPLLDEKVALRATAGGYVQGFDVQSAGPADPSPSDVTATLMALQAARHYDRDDGGHDARLEETAATALQQVLAADAQRGGRPSDGLPGVLPLQGHAQRSGLTTALAVVVLGDVIRDLEAAPGQVPSPGP